MAGVQEKVEVKKREKRVSKPLHKEKTIKSATRGSSPAGILKAYRPLFEENSSIISNAQNGLPISAVSDFSLLSNKSQKEIAALIHTTPKTLQNYASSSKKLPTLQSELLLKLFALYGEGLEVFADVENFNDWLRKPAFGLYNEIPETLLSTSTGINEVVDELIRIQYGDLA